MKTRQEQVSVNRIENIIINKVSTLSTSSGRIFDKELSTEDIFDMYKQSALAIHKLIYGEQSKKATS